MNYTKENHVKNSNNLYLHVFQTTVHFIFKFVKCYPYLGKNAFFKNIKKMCYIRLYISKKGNLHFIKLIII